MEIHPIIKKSLQTISFPERYKSLSERFSYSSQSLQQYSNETVAQIAADLGLRFVKKDNFFTVQERNEDFDFNLNISLKYGSVESILGVQSKEKRIVDGGPFGVIYRQVTENDERIKLPSFRTYEDLQEILQEVLCIYKDFIEDIVRCDPHDRE
jgi:hypothetical protein